MELNDRMVERGTIVQWGRRLEERSKAGTSNDDTESPRGPQGEVSNC